MHYDSIDENKVKRKKHNWTSGKLIKLENKMTEIYTYVVSSYFEINAMSGSCTHQSFKIQCKCMTHCDHKIEYDWCFL